MTEPPTNRSVPWVLLLTQLLALDWAMVWVTRSSMEPLPLKAGTAYLLKVC